MLKECREVPCCVDLQVALVTAANGEGFNEAQFQEPIGLTANLVVQTNHPRMSKSVYIVSAVQLPWKFPRRIVRRSAPKLGAAAIKGLSKRQT